MTDDHGRVIADKSPPDGRTTFRVMVAELVIR